MLHATVYKPYNYHNVYICNACTVYLTEMKQEIQTMTRFGQGAKIALYGRIVKVHDKTEWWVFSETKPEKFYVVKDDGSCSCPDYQYRGVQCKHAIAVDIRYSVMHEIKEAA
jgi:predicted nucleic acid-binding Zn finger protein